MYMWLTINKMCKVRSISDLPPEILITIFRYLDQRSLANATIICKYGQRTLESRISGKFIPIAVKSILRRHKNTDTTKAAMLDIYANALKYLQECTVQFDKYLPTPEQVETTVEFLIEQGLGIDDVKCFDQLKALTNFIKENKEKDEYKDKLSHERWVMFFKNCVSVEQYSEFETIAQYLFAIPAHNANIERIFNLIKSQWTDERHRLLIESYREKEVVRLCLKHFRQQGYHSAFKALQKQTNVTLESQLMSELHETLVENGNFAKTEEYVEQFASDGLIDCTKQPYKAMWSVQDQLRNPGMKPDMRTQMRIESICLVDGDLWYYDIKLNQWTLIHERAELNNGPCPRYCHKMIFDPAKSQIFTLGRYVDNVTRTNFNITSDFYLYNVRTNSWLLISKDTSQVGGPFPLLDHQMCIDVAENTIYVFGGRILTQRNIQDLSNDPQYSGLYSYQIGVNMWRQILVDCNHPSASNPDVYSIKSRATHSMLFHHRYRKLYVFAGQRNKEYTPEFISIDLDSRAITVMSSDCENMPQCGFTQRATIDCERDEIYVHTSLSKEKERKDINFNVLWMFSLKTNQWSCIYRRNHSKLQCLTKLDRSCTEPCPRFAHQLIYDVNSKIHFLFGGNPGNNSVSKRRLDDFWLLRLDIPTAQQVLQHYKFLIRKLEYEEIARVDPLQAMCYLQTSLSDVVDHSDSEQLKQFHKLPTLLFNNEPPQCASFSSTPMCSSPDLENSSSSSQSHHYNHCSSKICCFGKASPPSSDSDECRLNNYEGLCDHKVKRCVLFNKIVKLLSDHMLQPKGNLSDFILRAFFDALETELFVTFLRSINELPPEILTIISRYLDQRSLANATIICKYWKEVIEDACRWKIVIDSRSSKCEQIHNDDSFTANFTFVLITVIGNMKFDKHMQSPKHSIFLFGMKVLLNKKEARLEKKKKKITALAEIMKLNDADRQKHGPLLNESSDEPPMKRSKMDETQDPVKVLAGADSTTDDYKGNKKLVKERIRTRAHPKFRLKLSGDSAMVNIDGEVRTPIFLSDVQHLIMTSLLGSSSPYPPLRWCTIEKSNNIVHSVVLVVEGLSLYHYQCYESCLAETSSIFSNNVLEVIMPTDSEGLLFALSSLPVTLEQREELNEKFGSVEACKDDVQPLVNSVFPIASSHQNGEVKPVYYGEETFPRTKLLLSALQMVDEAYPLPLQGELANRFKDFVMTKNEYRPVTSSSPMFGLDCEMCFTSAGCNEVTRISVVNERYESIYETLVLPKNKIVNYLTPYSGITAEMMSNVTKSLDEVQRDLQKLLPPDAILVGQSLNCDLHAMKMMHPYIIDTSVIFNLSGVPRIKSKLQTLAREFLGEQIQANPLGHDSIEDCATAIKLVKLKLSKGICFGDAYLNSRAIASKKTEQKCNRSTLLITSVDESKLNGFPKNATKGFQLLQVTGNKCAVKKTCELAVQNNLTMTHLHVSPERLEESTVEKTMSSVDRWISKVYDKLSVNGVMIVLFGDAPGSKSGVAMVKIKKHQSTYLLMTEHQFDTCSQLINLLDEDEIILIKNAFKVRSINDLPPEILTIIFRYLDQRSLANATIICKYWKGVIEDACRWKIYSTGSLRTNCLTPFISNKICNFDGLETDIMCEPDDDYDHADQNAEYVIENVLMEKPKGATSKSFEDLSNLYNSFYDSHCNCDTATNCGDSKKCHHGACYTVFDRNSNERELVLNKERNVKDLLYECNSQCSCSTKFCANRLVQLGPRKHLQIVRAKNLPNQFALATDEYIPQGGFICEYAGEVLTESEALKRNLRNRDQKLKNYLICLNEHLMSGTAGSGETSQSLQTFIDAGVKSNIGRYLNHSCDPNCDILSVRIDGPVPKLGIFANRDILTGEELCFDYGDVKNVFSDKQLCLCDAVNCRKYF
ncbi:Muskelin [Pseudolycoriella hygida]|uniref:Muskelin n=1 Tax=Pseudolycoriella hygida TaxID=35572 RepID=A0A9Q0N653_9DIPT|nr:Muskelin [Pseudolycoriella hygida]